MIYSFLFQLNSKDKKNEVRNQGKEPIPGICSEIPAYIFTSNDAHMVTEPTSR